MGAPDRDLPPLDERSRAVLDFERASWKLTGTKERAIRERFGFSPARYHQLLHRIIDRPEALAYDPMLVRRLRRVREARRRARTASHLGVRV
ncbi:MAG TPA: DUF3263 domain-containing protein [Actinomycetota bacterium]|nr:DUF3263 domain-containing protein [Actinomycetota bacterium]